MPKVSVIIPTYQHRDYVLQALESVFAQTLKDYELIVVNDGSPDDTRELLRPFVEDGRIRYYEQPNSSQSVARNQGISLARGTYVALLDDDDFWPRDKLHWQVEALEQHPDAVAVYGYQQSYGVEPVHCVPPLNAQVPSGWVKTEFSKKNWIKSPGQILIRTETLRTLGGFDEELWGVDDWDLYIRLSSLGRIMYVPRLSLYYRHHPTNASRNGYRMYKNALRLHRKHFGRFPSPRELSVWLASKKFISRMGATLCVNQAVAYSRNRDWGNARRMWANALIARPSSLRKISGMKYLALAIFPKLFMKGKYS